MPPEVQERERGVKGASELPARAAALRPLLEKNAAATEANRRVTQDNIEAIQDAGLFRLWVPKRFGGYQADMRTFLDVTSALGEGCGSTAWVTGLIDVCSWMASLYGEQAQEEVFGADPDARVAGVLAPTAETSRVDGGLIVSGKWGWASGSLHATWAVVGVPVVDATGAVVDQGLALIPMSQLSIEDTWFVTGMRGTGSNTLVAHEVFVPDHRILSVPRAIEGSYPTPYTDEVLYRSSFIPILALVLVGPLLGLARAALQLVIEKAPKRAVSYTFIERQSDSTAFQLLVAQAAMKIDSAHLHAYRAAADIDGAAARGEYLDFLTRARVRADTGYVSSCVREAVDTLVSAHGGSSFAESSALQRIWRDVNTGGRHAVVNSTVSQEVYGKALLGIEPTITALI